VTKYLLISNNFDPKVVIQEKFILKIELNANISEVMREKESSSKVRITVT
jgi:hypothetical protein